jgi:ketosteroid isomerase-like protein
MNEAEQRGCDLVRAFFSALSDGDLEAVRMFLHPSATWEVMRAVPGERLSVGRDAIVDGFVAPVRGRFVPGDPKVTVRTVLASGDTVAAETRPTARCSTEASITTDTRGSLSSTVPYCVRYGSTWTRRTPGLRTAHDR